MTPLVSVIIPVWNDEATIARAVDSVLAQHFAYPVETIVVNDGSTDGTASILSRYGDRIRIISQRRYGLAAARNAGAEAASGTYLAFLDADDYWTAQKLARCYAAIQSDQHSSMVYCDAVKVDEAGRIVAASYYRGGIRMPSMTQMLDDFYNILPSTVMTARRNFDAIGGFCKEFGTAQPICEDAWFWLRMRELGPFVFVAEPLIYYTTRTSFADTLRRRGIIFDADARAEFGQDRIARLVENYDLLMGLVGERYGAGGRGFIGSIRARRVRLLTAVGLSAFAAGDRPAARAIYRYAFRLGPERLKSAIRLGFAALPPALTRLVTGLTSERLGRSLAGPALV